MAFPTIHIQDCFEISKKFERAANSCVTTESVFAVMAPILNNMRILSQTFMNQVDNSMNFKVGALSNRNQANSNEAYDAKVNGQSLNGDDFGENLANKMKECFPCSLRFEAAEDFWTSMWSQMASFLQQVGRSYEAMLNQLLGLQDFFNLDNEVADICSLQQFFTDFFCIPDLSRMIAALMALLAKMAVEINGSFNVLLTLIAPLMMPFLQCVMSMLTQFVMLIVRPLTCVIDSIIAFLNKLDYSALFDSPPANVSIGPANKYKKGNNKSSLTLKGSMFKPKVFNTPDASLYGIPQTQFAAHGGGQDVEIGAFERPDLNWGGSVDINPLHAVNRQEAANVNSAKQTLQNIKNDRSNIDLTDPAQSAAYNAKLEAARTNLKEAETERDFTEVQKARETLTKFKTYIKGVFNLLLSYIREAIGVVESLLEDIGNEFKKLIKSFTGASDTSISALAKKKQILKLIELIAAMIQLISGQRSCNAEQPIDISAVYPKKTGVLIWSDPDGTVHIEENGADLEDAMQALVLAGQGIPPSGDSTPVDNSLGSLIKVTGDPTLDATIAKVVEKITIPSKVVFRCNLETSKTQVEQVNKWIDELNTI